MAGPGLAAIVDNEALSIRIFAIAPMLAATAAMVSGCWGMFRYPRQTIIFILYLPVLLWLSFPGFNLMVAQGWGVGAGVLAVGVVFLIAALRPAANADPGHFSPSKPAA